MTNARYSAGLPREEHERELAKQATHAAEVAAEAARAATAQAALEEAEQAERQAALEINKKPRAMLVMPHGRQQKAATKGILILVCAVVDCTPRRYGRSEKNTPRQSGALILQLSP